MGFPGGNYIIFRHVLLQHEPHRFYVVSGVTPVALGSQIAEQPSWSMANCMQAVAKRGCGVIVILARAETADQLLASVDMALGEPAATGTAPPDSYTTVGLGSQILRDLGVGKIHLMGAPIKYNAISGFDLEVLDFVQPGQ